MFVFVLPKDLELLGFNVTNPAPFKLTLITQISAQVFIILFS